MSKMQIGESISKLTTIFNTPMGIEVESLLKDLAPEELDSIIRSLDLLTSYLEKKVEEEP
ncbi:hypothetical protein [Paenibacillus sp. OAS669]|uniref:hypothetical protein n=1 Tax=Paenibacillus sp. OAS669 TaxID=2663821 RepID=UPI00178A31B4|nr:hypothetical protein [Paenibacillus sp. OAS669]MBE1440968.1 hypothetical protein [Paenibacillus sp. OAS669]